MSGEQAGPHGHRPNSTPQNQPMQSNDPNVILSSLMGEIVIVTYDGKDGPTEVTGKMDCIMPPLFVIITPLDQKREFISMNLVRRIKETRAPNVAGINDGT
jgi:hypothetical protein